MQKQRIPELGREVSRIFLGTASAPFSTGGDGSGLIESALEMGINAIDTARVYGLSENSLGRWLEKPGNREKVVLLTKCGHPAEDGTRRVNAREMKRDLALSLEALRTEVIDLYLLHRDDPETPVGEILETFQEMKEAGRIRAFGGSNWTVARLREANEYAAKHGLQPMTVSSPQFGLASQVKDPWDGSCVTVSGPMPAPTMVTVFISHLPQCGAATPPPCRRRHPGAGPVPPRSCRSSGRRPASRQSPPPGPTPW
jgi:aryl-alcohol dehydrogenase-like predicted oxidoreductase